ncbi:MAG: TerB family tellurite resistance protein [Oligoflexia bacterium]|nr:TerB family tellurite resistance protein [Oligoflexia bacterium]
MNNSVESSAWIEAVRLECNGSREPMRDQEFREFFKDSSFLHHDMQGLLATTTLRLAVVTLLWDMVNVNEERTAEEYVACVKAIDREFHITDEEAGRLISAVDLLRARHRQLEDALALINQSYNAAQKNRLMHVLIEIAKADGHIDDAESEFAAYLRDKLLLVELS